MISQSSPGGPGGPEEGDGFGGGVWVLRGSPTGVTTSGTVAFKAADLGVGGREAMLGGTLLP